MANDFRGYLQSVDPYALQYTGNDGLIDRTKVGYDAKGYQSFQKQGNSSQSFGNLQNGLQDYISKLYSTYQSQQAAQPVANPNATLQAQLAALQAQMAYTPKLANFDVVGNYNAAKSKAEASVNPLYDKYLNDFLAQNQVKRDTKTGEVANTKATDALDLSQTLAGNDVSRTRSNQDTASALDLLGTQEKNMQQDTGTAFDIQRRSDAEANAAAGTNTSGIGAGKMFDANTARNVSEARAVAESNNQKAAKTLLNTRTLEDLSRNDSDAQAIAANKDKNAQFDLDTYLQELAGDETNFRNDNEVKRTADVASQSQTYAQQGTQSFLQSLAGAGYRPQDIALAYQVYG